MNSNLYSQDHNSHREHLFDMQSEFSEKLTFPTPIRSCTIVFIVLAVFGSRKHFTVGRELFEAYATFIMQFISI